MKFYLNLRIVYCETYSISERTKLKSIDRVFESTMNEADQNYAHKDPRHLYRELKAPTLLVKELKVKISHCKNLCSKHFPSCVTLDFVEHDPILFRLLYKIDKEEEEKLLKLKHPGYGEPIDSKSIVKTCKVFHDTEQIKGIKNPDDYAAIVSCGLTERETIQTLQDGLIRTNVLNGTDYWAVPKKSEMLKMREFLESIGLGYLY